MPHVTANEIELYYESTGCGEPLVLIHGGWSDHDNWLPVLAGLAESFRVVTYDRRGHGKSERGDQGTRRDQEDDVAALIEELELGPAHVVGTSFGGSIALGLASRRPELVRGVVAHEPPLMSMIAGDPALAPMMADIQVSLLAVLARIAGGDAEGAARQFVNEIALGPGAWDILPEPLRATMVDSAPAFAAEQEDEEWASVDLDGLREADVSLLLTQGDQSPPWFPPIVTELARAIGSTRVLTYPGAGHAPHLTHPADYLPVVTDFLSTRMGSLSGV
jgi:pimeloyl-ACP methyl ester carboxylesterase